jgi:hypothetical protein
LLDYKKLDVFDGVIDAGNLKDWSTIVLKVDEQFSGLAGQGKTIFQDTKVWWLFPRES